MRLSKSLYSSGVLNNGKVLHCNEWDIGDYRSTNSSAARWVRNAQVRRDYPLETTLKEEPSLWRIIKNVLRIG